MNGFGTLRGTMLFTIQTGSTQRGRTFTGAVKASGNAGREKTVAVFIEHSATTHQPLDPTEATMTETIMPKLKLLLGTGKVGICGIKQRRGGLALRASGGLTLRASGGLNNREREEVPVHRPPQIVNVTTFGGVNSKRTGARGLKLELPILEVVLRTKQPALARRNIVSLSGNGFRLAIRCKNLPLDSTTTKNRSVGPKKPTDRDCFRRNLRNEIVRVMSKRMGSASIKKNLKGFAGRRDTRDITLKGLDMVTLKFRSRGRGYTTKMPVRQVKIRAKGRILIVRVLSCLRFCSRRHQSNMQ
jgi:hypothetical protein